MINILALVACYLMGAIPFGLIIGKLTKGVDIRDYGSGNIGASNVLRTLGTVPALFVLFFDTAKGFAAILLCENILHLGAYLVLVGGLLSVFGHSFSLFLRFKGGKGVATSLGVIIGLNPIIALIAFVLWGLLVLTTRYISIASIITAISVPIQMIFWKTMKVPFPYQLFAVVAAFAIIIKHRSNIGRLISGTESRIGQKVDTRNCEGAKD